MKKIKITLASLGALLLPVVVFALDANTPPTVGGIGNIGNLITSIETFVWMIFGAIAVISFVVAGILFLTAGGAPEKVATARTAAIWGIAGIVVGILAYSILAIVGTAMHV
ncbi:MAG: hypothetical protein NTY81_03995 [Candidatus Staskawiczbacteria bacterium]|nr:hypothetical protein [Candidatus Staskawiczbacteria bacterium]